jgi:hypothetical protein
MRGGKGKWGRAARAAVGCLAFAGAALGTGEARAIPPPKAAAQLRRDSDVVATVRVLAVACTGWTTHPNPDVAGRLRTYRARLQVLEVHKGAVTPTQAVTVHWRDVPEGIVGDWQVAYHPGERVTTHLVWDGERGAYATAWWNAKGEPDRASEVAGLPEEPGQVVVSRALAAEVRHRYRGRLGVFVHGCPEGLRIGRVLADSPAERIGLEVGDVILAVDGVPTRTPEELRRAIAGPDGPLRLTLGGAPDAVGGGA